MKILKITALIFGLLLLMLLGFLQYMGYFTKTVIEEKDYGGFIVAGMDVVGPYEKVGESIEKVNLKLKQLEVSSTKGFGIYYDDPKMVAREKCRSFVGSIVDDNHASKLNSIVSAGLKVDTIKLTRSILSEFPLKNPVSYMIGPMKVYPKLSEYITTKKLKVGLSYEIYDRDQSKITFVMQYTQQ